MAVSFLFTKMCMGVFSVKTWENKEEKIKEYTRCFTEKKQMKKQRKKAFP